MYYLPEYSTVCINMTGMFTWLTEANCSVHMWTLVQMFWGILEERMTVGNSNSCIPKRASHLSRGEIGSERLSSKFSRNWIQIWWPWTTLTSPDNSLFPINLYHYFLTCQWNKGISHLSLPRENSVMIKWERKKALRL